MIRHLLKLAWNRKKSNALVIVEVFASFLVVFVVATSVAYIRGNAKLPLGFDARDVWSVRCSNGTEVNQGKLSEHLADMDRLVREVEAVPGVEHVGATFAVPYENSRALMSIPKDSGYVDLEFLDVSDSFADVFRIQVARGRWFGPEDEGRAWQPVVLNRRLAEAIFGDADPIGQPLPRGDEDSEARVVGIVEDFRMAGELSGAGRFLLRRISSAQEGTIPPREVAIRVDPQAGTDLEQAVLARMHAFDPSQTYELHRLEDLRAEYFRLRLAPLIVGGIVAAFLLMMVALGLLGVLWQNVTRRARELALRRSAGASGSDIRRQILLEVLLTTTPGVLMGTLLVVQIPMLDLVATLRGTTLATGLLVAVGSMYALTTVCALYPAWMAMRVLPAEALRCE